jgi:HPt (histidine-containing phosphotransfer) domain-containing protein
MSSFPPPSPPVYRYLRHAHLNMLIDYATLNELGSMLGQEQLTALVRLYLKHTRATFMLVVETGANATPAAHRHAVHSLRGGSLQLGTDALVSLCGRVESDLRATERLLTSDEIECLRTTFEDTHEALTRWLGETEGPTERKD